MTKRKQKAGENEQPKQHLFEQRAAEACANIERYNEGIVEASYVANTRHNQRAIAIGKEKEIIDAMELTSGYYHETMFGILLYQSTDEIVIAKGIYNKKNIEK